MSQISKVTNYVENIFDLYEIDKHGFFFEYDDDTDDPIEVPLFRLNNIDDDTMERISAALGLTKSEIFNMNEAASKKYWNKYDFFHLFQEYKELWAWYSRFQDDMPITDRADYSNRNVCGQDRYDYSDVKRRMIAKLKEIDAVIPNTYHKNASIIDLSINTEVFFSFPKCTTMLRSFIEMVKRVEELFFKAIKKELNEEEINELNFLATWLNACDAMDSHALITYNNICMYRDIYIEENLTDFFSYVRIKRFINTAPWRCQEFFDDMELVQQFVNIFPQAKSQMHQFAMDVTKFSCIFMWSDVEPSSSSDENQDFFDVDSILNESIDSFLEADSKWTHVYVDKTPDEILGWEIFIQRLKRAASPASQGGLILPTREVSLDLGETFFSRMRKRLEIKHGGNK